MASSYSTKDDIPTLSLEQIGAHASRDDCWVAVRDKVWDVTEFLEGHPGGVEGMCGEFLISYLVFPF